MTSKITAWVKTGKHLALTGESAQQRRPDLVSKPVKYLQIQVKHQRSRVNWIGLAVADGCRGSASRARDRRLVARAERSTATERRSRPGVGGIGETFRSGDRRRRPGDLADRRCGRPRPPRPPAAQEISLWRRPGRGCGTSRTPAGRRRNPAGTDAPRTVRQLRRHIGDCGAQPRPKQMRCGRCQVGIRATADGAGRHASRPAAWVFVAGESHFVVLDWKGCGRQIAHNFRRGL